MAKSNPKPARSKGPTSHLKFKICVSGSAEIEHCPPGTVEKAIEIGRIIAKKGMVLVTGATTGIPYWAAKGAKGAGGMVIGLSPASSMLAHVKAYKLPVDYHDLIIYTGFDYSGRNLLLTRSADAIITIYGRIGTLNEFTIAFEDQKPQGVLTGTGGTTDIMKGILEKSHRGMGKTIFESDPEALIDKLIAMIEAEHQNVVKFSKGAKGPPVFRRGRG